MSCVLCRKIYVGIPYVFLYIRMHLLIPKISPQYKIFAEVGKCVCVYLCVCVCVIEHYK